KVLLLDEPTKGVDVGARHEIYDIIRELAATGVAVLLVSSDFEEVLTLCDRLLFLHEGRQGQTVVNTNIRQEEYLTFCYQGETRE
ncbi:MAG: D-xylose ABC transporter ATP-binding protein, partial [Spirochaetaceae bacterium]|nr:D-xylose ABC transporter ATP-binding protein [Spirochaetaceae bacterium]